MALQIRRGTDTQRQALSGPNTPIAGELLYNTDNKKLYIGDGTTTGGTSIGYFGSVAVSGQSTIKSTGVNEALTIVAGANISLITDANTGTLTIAAAPQELNNGSLRLFQNNISSINSNENINIAPAGTGQVNITSSLIVAGGIATSLIRTTESKITLGLEAGQTSQGNFTVAIGYGAGKTSQGQNSVAIGVDSGKISQLYDSIAVGYGAGFRNQGNYAVALGASAGRVGQGEAAVAIGGGAGGTGDVNGLIGGQGAFAVAIGYNSALGDQGSYAVAIGTNAGNGQGVNAVAIGVNAGAEQQGTSSVAIGSYAGQTSQPARTTIINASGSVVNGVAAQTDSFYVSPIRNSTGTSGVLQYNSTTKEVSYNNTVSVTSVTANTISTSGVTISQNNITSATSNSNLVFDTSGTGRIELRSPTEGSRLELYTDFVGSGLFIANNSATNAGFVLVNSHDTASLSPTYVAAPLGSSQTGSPASYARSRGNALFPSAVLNNDEIMAFDFLGQTDPVNQLRSAAKLKIIADSAPSAGNVAGRFEFSTTSSSGAQAVRFTVSSTAVTSTVPISNGSLQLFQNNLTGLNSNEDIVIAPSGTGGVKIDKVAAPTATSTSASIGYLGVPVSAVTSTGTLTLADAGKHIYINTTGQTITIPANGTVAYPIGTTIAFIAGPSATTVTIAIATDTMYLAGPGTTGSRTLAAFGMASAVKIGSTSWIINGAGLT